MSKEQDEIEKRLKELDPKYEEIVSNLPKMETSAENTEKKPRATPVEDRILYDVIGGLVGERVAGATQKGLEKEVERRALRESRGIRGHSSMLGDSLRRLAAEMPPAEGGVAPSAPAAPEGDRAGRILRGTTEEGISGRARSTGFNVQTAQEAANQRQMQALIDQMRQRGVVGSSAQEIFARAPGMTASQHGVLMPRTEARPTVGPRPPEPFVGPPVPPASVGYTQAPPQQPGALQRAGQAFGTGARVAGNVAMDLLSSPRLAGAAGGVGVAEGLQQYYGRREQDPLGAGLALMAAGAGGLSTLPILPMNLRVGLGVASPLTMYLYDKLRPYQSVLERPSQ